MVVVLVLGGGLRLGSRASVAGAPAPAASPTLLLTSSDELDAPAALLLSGDMTDGDDRLLLSGDMA